jgi:hypothetical protein
MIGFLSGQARLLEEVGHDRLRVEVVVLAAA